MDCWESTLRAAQGLSPKAFARGGVASARHITFADLFQRSLITKGDEVRPICSWKHYIENMFSFLSCLLNKKQDPVSAMEESTSLHTSDAT